MLKNILAVTFSLIILFFIGQGTLRKNVFDIDEVRLIYSVIPDDIHESENLINSSSSSFSIFQVIKENRSGGSLDPGGFNILLYLWSWFSLNITWLTLLPVLMFIMALSFIYKSFSFLTNEIDTRLAALALILWIESFYQSAFIIKPYSFELAGYAFLSYSFNRERMNFSLWSLFLTARYQFIASSLGFFMIRFKSLFKRIGVLLPIATLVLIFSTSLYFQFKKGRVIFPKDIFLSNQDLRTIYYNFVEPDVLNMFICPLLLFLLFKGRLNKLTKGKLYFAFYLINSAILLDFLEIAAMQPNSRYLLGFSFFGWILMGEVYIKTLERLPGKVFINSVVIAASLLNFSTYKQRTQSDVLSLAKRVGVKNGPIYLDTMSFAGISLMSKYSSNTFNIPYDFQKLQSDTFGHIIVNNYNQIPLDEVEKWRLVRKGAHHSLFLLENDPTRETE